MSIAILSQLKAKLLVVKFPGVSFRSGDQDVRCRRVSRINPSLSVHYLADRADQLGNHTNMIVRAGPCDMKDRDLGQFLIRGFCWNRVIRRDVRNDMND